MNYEFKQFEDGPLRVFEYPQAGMPYTMGVDAATGLGNDNSAIQVMTNTLPSRQVCRFKGQVPVHEFSDTVDKVGRWYNNALNMCEVNYPGNSVQEALLQYYHYPRNYQPETHLDEDLGISSRYGFRTTEATKWMLINEFQQSLESNEILIFDPDTVDELMNFVYEKDKNKSGAAKGFCDDLVISLMLANHGVRLYPFVVKGESKGPKIIKVDSDTQRCWRLFKAKMAGRSPRLRRATL